MRAAHLSSELLFLQVIDQCEANADPDPDPDPNPNPTPNLRRVVLQPTREAVALAGAMRAALGAHGGGAWTQRALRHGHGLQGWQAAEDEQLSFELLAPSHGETARVGAAVRALPCTCWLNARVAQATSPSP